MSDKTDRSVDLQAEKEELQKLIRVDTERKADGKVALPSKRSPFISAWVNVSLAMGINAETVGYLIDGVRLAEAEPLHAYAERTDAVDAYQAFFKDRRLALNENGCMTRILLNLFALELMSPSSPNPLDFIARRLAGCPGNRRGKLMEQMVTRLVIRPLANTPISAEAEMSAISANSLMPVLRPSLEAPQKANANKTAANSLLGWLEEHANPIELGTSGTDSPTATEDAPQVAQSNGDTDAKPSNGQDPSSIDGLDVGLKETYSIERVDSLSETIQEERLLDSTTTEMQPLAHNPKRLVNRTTTRAETASNRKDKSKKEAKRSELDMDGVIAFLTDYHSERESLDARLEEARKEAREAQEQVEKLKSVLKSTQRKSEELRDQRSTLSANYAEIQRKLEEIVIEKDRMREDLTAAEDMLTMLEERNAHAADVADEKMVDELRFEYEQYQDAIQLPMSDDLGEIMRDNLGKVFEILKENGIDL